jgi:flavin-dependent dehydrogenase
VAVSGDNQPRVVILGAGLSGLVLATLLAEEPVSVLIIEQDLPPGRSPAFHGIVTGLDLLTIRLNPDDLEVRRVSGVASIDSAGPDSPSHIETPNLWSVEHRALLGALRTRFRSRGGRIIANQGEVEFVWSEGAVGGLRLLESGLTFDADLVVLADESDPRLAEQLGLRPDWPPTQLMHVAKQRYEQPRDRIRDRFGDPDDLARITSFTAVASWGPPGYGLVVPGQDAVTVKVAMLLEDEMATARHIREYLDEQQGQAPLRDLLDGLEPGAFVTECTPVGGFDARPRFHTDNVLVVNDLVGMTHPLNRDGFSTTLAMCQAAADVIRGGEFTSRRLAEYSKRLAKDLIAPVNARRASNQGPPWQWASLPELLTGMSGVTSDPNSAKLLAGSGSGIVGRLRKLGRRPGVTRHPTGAYDE